MGGKSSKAVGRDETINNHAEEFGTRHSTVNSSGFHPSIIELHAPSAGMGIMMILLIIFLILVAIKVASLCMRHRSHHRALRHYYHVRESANIEAPLYPSEPRQEDYFHAQRQFQGFRRPSTGLVQDRLQVIWPQTSILYFIFYTSLSQWRIEKVYMWRFIFPVPGLFYPACEEKLTTCFWFSAYTYMSCYVTFVIVLYCPRSPDLDLGEV